MQMNVHVLCVLIATNAVLFIHWLSCYKYNESSIFSRKPKHSSEFLDISMEDFMDLTARETRHVFDNSSKFKISETMWHK